VEMRASVLMPFSRWAATFATAAVILSVAAPVPAARKLSFFGGAVLLSRFWCEEEFARLAAAPREKVLLLRRGKSTWALSLTQVRPFWMLATLRPIRHSKIPVMGS